MALGLVPAVLFLSVGLLLCECLFGFDYQLFFLVMSFCASSG